MITGVLDLVEHEQKELEKRGYKREADQKIRQKQIGGSDASIIAKVNPFKNIVELWEEKIGTRIPPNLSNIEKILWGILLEDTIAREYGRRTGKKVRQVNKTFKHKDHDFLGGHIDRKIEGENAGVEVKNVGLRQVGYWNSGVPIYYEYQVLHYLAITGYDYFDVVALVGGQELIIHKITREGNEDRIEKLVNDEVKFWNDYVLTKTPPPPETTSECETLFPVEEVEKVSYLPNELNHILDEYHLEFKNFKTSEKKLDGLKAIIQNHMGNAAYCENSEGQRVAKWVTQTRSSLDQKQMKIANPEFCEKFTKTSSFRRFSVISNKESK